jgi:uncharacterized protein (TIGR03663 family)
MNRPIKFWLYISAVFIIALVLRTGRLDSRQMHGDEAVHAYKFGQLLEHNYYRYDPTEFHGPTLNYFTLVPASLSGKHTYASLTEFTLRIVPAFFGLILVLLPLLLIDGISKPAALVAAFLTAISPAFVFYSRYYIPEILLVFFTFCVVACAYRYAQNRKPIWAILTGISAGLCIATKETWLIAFGSMAAAYLLVMLIHRPAKSPNPRHLIWGLIAALAVWVLFYSSFFTNPKGLLDSFLAFKTYFGFAVANTTHFHPWYYYLELLIYNKASTWPPWTEAFVVILASFGAILIILRKGIANLDRRLLDFLLIFTVITLALYSVIPYKTPWCLLSFYYGMILLAAIGVAALLNLSARLLTRVLFIALFVILALDLGLQARLSCFSSNVDYSNPYVYAHPTKNVIKIAERIEQISKADPAGDKITILVVCPTGDYWPLPWYLRDFKNVGWFSDANEIKAPAPVVIASPQLESAIVTKLYNLSPPGRKNLYVSLFDAPVYLRPDVELLGFITKDLLDESGKSNAGR